MKRRSFFYVLAAGVLVLLLIGAGGFYWLRANSPLALIGGGQVTNPTATIFVPKQAPVMVSLLVNPDRLEGLRQAVARPANRKRSRAELNQFKQSLLANTDLDYRRDIQPWLGDEITLALTSLDIDRTRDNGEQRGLLLAVTTKNPQRSREFVDLFWQKQANVETDLVFETYKGVKLIYRNQDSGVKTQDAGNKGFYNRDKSASLQKDAIINRASTQNTIASAVVGDRFVLFANHPRVLREAINNVQAPNLSLSDSTSYQRAIESISQPKIGLTYVNLPALAKLLGNNSQMEISQTYESLAIALSPKTQGLLAETALLAATGQEIPPTTPTLSQPVGALQYLPEKIAIAASGSNLEQWTQLTSRLDSNDSFAQLINQPIANLQARWGIDLRQDIFSWVQGEYALGMLPRPDRKDSDWIFVAERATTKAEESIDRLDAIAKQQGLSVSSFTLENQPISAWTKLTTTADKNQGEDQDPVRLEAQVKGVHASIGKYEIFTTSIEAMNQAIKAPNNSLVKSDRFQANIASLPQPNNGYLYLDWASSQAFLERQLPIVKVVELVAKPLFNELNSLAFSSYGSDDGVRRSKVFLRLGAKAEE